MLHTYTFRHYTIAMYSMNNYFTLLLTLFTLTIKLKNLIYNIKIKSIKIS